MVRKYKPTIDETWHSYEHDVTRTPDMEECKHGEWVRLETYVNETKRLKKQIEKLKRITNAR